MADDDDFMFDGGDDDFGSGEEYAFDDDPGDPGDAPNEDPQDEEIEQTPENLYYQAKNIEEENPEECKNLLKKVTELDKEERSEYGFKAPKRLVKMTLKGIISSDIINDFKIMLSYADVVGVNDMENGVNAIIQIINNDLTTTSKKIDPLVANRKLELVEEFATLASECYMRNKNERAWIRINIRIIELQLDVRQKILFQCQADESAPPSLPDLSYFSNKLQKLVEWCELAPGVNNPKRESFLLDIIALQKNSDAKFCFC